MSSKPTTLQVTARLDVVKLANIKRWLANRGLPIDGDSALVRKALDELWASLVRTHQVTDMDLAEAWSELRSDAELSEAGIDHEIARNRAIEAMFEEDDDG